jgi:hypothetical protein
MKMICFCFLNIILSGWITCDCQRISILLSVSDSTFILSDTIKCSVSIKNNSQKDIIILNDRYFSTARFKVWEIEILSQDGFLLDRNTVFPIDPIGTRRSDYINISPFSQISYNFTIPISGL